MKIDIGDLVQEWFEFGDVVTEEIVEAFQSVERLLPVELRFECI